MESQKTPSAPRLPSRPLDELPKDHCTLRSRSFSYLPRKYRALVTLPPMRPHAPLVPRSVLRSRKTTRNARSQQLRKEETPPAPVPGCYGDFCNAEFKYPQILQDIETGTDSWSRQGRLMCHRHAEMEGQQLGTLMKPEELAACLQDSDSEAELSPKTGGTGRSVGATKPAMTTAGVKEGLLDLPASQVLEARSHPGLCQWLESLDWRVNPEDALTVLAAAAHLASDEAAVVPRNMSLRMDVSVPGMRYRLRPVKVCRTCFNTYQVINQMITLVRHQHKDRWAKAEIQRRKKQEEKEKEQAQEAYIQRVIGDPGERAAALNKMERCPPCLPRQSLIFDPEVTMWMRGIPESSGMMADMVKVMWMKAQDYHSEEIIEAPPSSPESGRHRRRGAVMGHL